MSTMELDTTSVPSPPTMAAEAPAVPADEMSAPIVEGPITMSFPSILRNPGVSRFVLDRVAGSEGRSNAKPHTVRSKSRRDEKEGKRWIRRDENARFVHNPHVVRATRADLTLPTPPIASTFPHPLPRYLPRTQSAPSAIPSVQHAPSASAGRFSLSLRGMRRELRAHGPATEALVRDVEVSLLSWLGSDGVLLEPDLVQVNDLEFSGTPVDENGRVLEVQRTPLQLIWDSEDAFARYIIHCCARYHEVVSFSKETPSGRRLTHILRPNIVRPSVAVHNPLDTPPVTDLSASELSTHELTSAMDTESEGAALSDVAELSDVDRLSAVGEVDSRPESPAFNVARMMSDDEWSIIHEHEAEADEPPTADDLVSSVESLSLVDHDRLARSRRPLGRSASAGNPWARAERGASSPSRSPARRAPLRRLPPTTGGRKSKKVMGGTKSGKSLYEYLYG